jgi:putrescine aminotransferase
MKKLYSLKDIEKFSIDDVWDMYRKYVNNSQVDLISKFGFGNDIAIKAEKNFIFTKSGKKIYDFTGGIGVLNHGHNHERILSIRQWFQKNKFMEVHKNYFSPYIAALSSNISFHGKKLVSSNVTNSKETRYFQFQELVKSDNFEFNNFNSLKEKILALKKNGKCNVYAVILEPFSASSLLSLSEEFLRKTRDLCDKNEIVLIFDEVYSGWGKTGNLFYFMNYEGLIPDILTSGKSLGGGKASISAYTCRDKFFKKAYDNLRDATLHSTTFNGLGEETATAIEAINIVIEENFIENSKNIFKFLNSGLKKLQQKYPKIVKDVRGAGALNGVIINTDFSDKFLQPIISLIPSKFTRDEYAIKKIIVSAYISQLYDEYNILTFYGSNIDLPLKISCPLNIEKEHLDYFLRSFEKLLEEGTISVLKKFIKKIFFN